MPEKRHEDASAVETERLGIRLPDGSVVDLATENGESFSLVPTDADVTEEDD